MQAVTANDTVILFLRHSAVSTAVGIQCVVVQFISGPNTPLTSTCKQHNKLYHIAECEANQTDASSTNL